MRKLNVLIFLLFPVLSFAQIVDEVIQLDTITETVKVIFKPSAVNSSGYVKKIGVFANDTAQVAVEKTYIRNTLNGIYKVYYPSGKPKVKAVFANGNPNGEFTWYNENGIIRVKGLYKDSVKHGFWAYKYLKIYGKYKKGKKHGKWYKLDDNRQKIKSYYSYGKLIKGQGFETDEVLPNVITSDTTDTGLVAVKNPPKTKNDEVSFEISEEYQQVVNYLKTNAVLRKTLKSYYGFNTGQLIKYKKNYKNNNFQFSISENQNGLDITSFVEDSKNNKIVVAKIDSVIKAIPDLNQQFTSAESKENKNLANYSTKKEAAVTVYFSEIIHRIMRVEVIWNKDEKTFGSDTEQLQQISKDQRFSILLYFNQKGDLAGAEYQKF